jgi:hypothetical protein
LKPVEKRKPVKQLAITIEDEQKAELLAQLVASLDFVQSIAIVDQDAGSFIHESDFYQDPR